MFDPQKLHFFAVFLSICLSILVQERYCNGSETMSIFWGSCGRKGKARKLGLGRATAPGCG